MRACKNGVDSLQPQCAGDGVDSRLECESSDSLVALPRGRVYRNHCGETGVRRARAESVQSRRGRPCGDAGRGDGSHDDVDASATPLAAAKAVAGNAAEIARYNSWDFLWNAFLGNVGGSLGETSALAILIGAAILLFTGVASWRTMSFVFIASPGLTPGPMFHLLTGGVMIGAFFMATDMVTSPVTHLGGVVFGVGIGVIVCVIRIWGSFPEGMSFAIVIMNALVPLIDKMCYKRPFGWHPSSVNILQPRRGEIK